MPSYALATPTAGRDVARALDGRVLGHQRLDHLLAHRATACRRSCRSGRSARPCALGPASSVKRPPAGPQCETIGTFQPMRSSDFTTWADGPTLPTRNSVSAPAAFRRVSCGTTSRSLASNFSTPTGRHALRGERGLQALLVRLAPRVVDQDHAGLARLERLLRVVEHAHVDDLVDRRRRGTRSWGWRRSW